MELLVESVNIGAGAVLEMMVPLRMDFVFVGSNNRRPLVFEGI